MSARPEDLVAYQLESLTDDEVLTAAADETNLWYVNRRRRALGLEPLTAAVKKFNPALHPRGKDGKFITKGGFVRFLDEAGKWITAQVSTVNEDGSISVKYKGKYNDVSMLISDPGKRLYSAPTPKATLSLPDISKESSKGFKKVGGQAGSNPGAFFEIESSPTIPVSLSTGTKAANPYFHDAVSSVINEDETDWDQLTGPIDDITATMGNLVYETNIQSSLSIGVTSKVNIGIVEGDDKAVFYELVLNDESDQEAARVVLEMRPTSDGQVLVNVKEEVYNESLPSPDQMKLVLIMDKAKKYVVGSLDLTLIDQNEPSNDEPTNDPVSGDKFYVKKAKSKDHAAVEVLANDLYRLAGVPVPDVFMGTDGETVGSKIVAGKREKLTDATPEQLQEIHESLVIDAWLANWDVVGLEYDNIVITDGKPYRIDAGGALRYRAQGGSKGALFGSTVGELESLRNKSINPQSATIFAGASQDSLTEGAKRLAAIDPETIKAFVIASGASDPDGLANTLIARRADLLQKLGVDDPYAGTKAKAAIVETSPVAAEPPKPPKPKSKPPKLDTISKSSPALDDMPSATVNSNFDVVKMLNGSEELDKHVGQLVMIMTEKSGKFDPADVPSYASKHLVFTGQYSQQPVIGILKKSVSDPPMYRVYQLGTDRPHDIVLTESKYGASKHLVFLLDGTGVESFDFALPKPTMRSSDKAVLIGGTQVGTWGGYKGNYRATINPEFSPTGQLVEVRSYSKSDLYHYVANMIVMSTDTGYANEPGYDSASRESRPPLQDIKIVKEAVTPSDLKIGDWVVMTGERRDPIVGRLLTVNKDDEGKLASDLPGESLYVGRLIDDASKKKYGMYELVRTTTDDGTSSPLTWASLGYRFDAISIIEPPSEELEPGQVSFGGNNTVISKGRVIGRYRRVGSDHKILLFPEFTLSGEEVILEETDKERVRLAALSVAMVKDAEGPADLPSKKPAAIAAKAATLGSFGGKIGDTEVVPGLTVSHPSGVTGKVTGWPNQEKYPGLVYVDPGDGSKKKKLYNVKKLTVVSGASATPTPGTAHLKTADGKTPVPGQRIKTGKNALVGTLVKVNPKNGYVTVLLDDGTKKTTTLATTYVLEEPDSTTGIPAAVGLVAAKLKTATKVPHLGELSALTVALPGQDDESREKYLAKGKRKPLSDGSVPYVGMFVKDKKGNRYMVAEIPHEWAKGPDRLVVVPVDADSLYAVKPVKRAASTLLVDVPAENSKGVALKNLNVLHTAYNVDEAKAVTVDLVPGSLVFYRPSSSRTGDQGSIVVLNPDGTYTYIDSGGNISKSQTYVNFVVEKFSSSEWQLIGYGDSDSTTTYVASEGSKYFHPDGKKKPVTGSFTYDLQSLEAAGSLEQLIASEVKKKAEQLVGKLPKFATVGNPLMPPPKPDSDAGPTIDLPKPTGNGQSMHVAPSVKGTMSVVELIQHTLDNKDSTAKGSAVTYSVMDGDQIVDQHIRLQVVVGPDGKEHIEARVKLMPSAADAIGTKILTGESKTGGWDSTNVSVTDLVEGDAISVREGTTAGASVLKPANDFQPNARIAGNPVKILDKEADGVNFDRYRVPIVFADGTTGEVDIEDRLGSSIKKYDYNWEKVSSGATLTVHPDAEQEGWALLGHLGVFPVDSVDEAGKKKYASMTNLHTYTSFGGTLSRVMPDGTVVRFGYVHPAEVSGYNADGYSSKRWHTLNNEVTITIPIDSESVETSLSDALEVLGINDSTQRPPKRRELMEMAVRKLAWTFDDAWEAGKDYEVSGDPNNPKTQELFAKIGAAIGLGRPLAFTDFVVATDTDGRVFVGLTEEVAALVTKKQGRTYYSHSITGGNGFVDTIVKILGGTSSGLLATDERWSRGIMINGMSSGTDVAKGSGDRIYLHTMTGASYSGEGIVINPIALNRTLDAYTSSNDSYGTSHRPWLKSGGAHETMYKGRIPPEVFAYVRAGSSQQRTKIIEMLKERGVTSIGSRSVEEIVLGPNDEIITTTEEFKKLGLDAYTITPLMEIDE